MYIYSVELASTGEAHARVSAHARAQRYLRAHTYTRSKTPRSYGTRSSPSRSS